jgi:hypothetical protein
MSGHLLLLSFQYKVLGMDDVTIEDLAFGVWPSKEADEVSRPRCLSTRQEKDAGYIMKKSMRRML